ncbi:hypothetical protein [Flammeovirga kamogawensis]|uniref:Copper resistance protein NlpE n=1 Tax=Flammeovirga kamogawensis TaxID=373891 RepID=A0ABX8H1U5_9BACT|nr:hypothetical protein [Flammeovirga kamogawensis]MBB6464057.1 hypothetical protein [Flammeovirga kamogawensis]QWG09871.1 hypothetical protein KM029_19515 [Flammeovirga kamogawensis]TRX65377.1 hypothetical protein EO216_22910 [Flammeovirga kamogawensis]
MKNNILYILVIAITAFVSSCSTSNDIEPTSPEPIAPIYDDDINYGKDNPFDDGDADYTNDAIPNGIIYSCTFVSRLGKELVNNDGFTLNSSGYTHDETGQLSYIVDVTSPDGQQIRYKAEYDSRQFVLTIKNCDTTNVTIFYAIETEYGSSINNPDFQLPCK